jgi:hypothetical protein
MIVVALYLWTLVSAVGSASNTVTHVLDSCVNQPHIVARTTESLSVAFKPCAAASISSDTVLAYEVSYRSLFDANWVIANTFTGNDDYTQLDTQLVSVRGNREDPISSGSFQLALQWESGLGEDFEDLARTSLISWNATASDFKMAMRSIASVKVKEVRRCDEFGPFKKYTGTAADKRGFGGTNGWTHGCPDGAAGGYRWLVVLQKVVETATTIPLMYLYRNLLGAGYSGSGNQVSITRLRNAYVSPTLCPAQTQDCAANVTGLEEGTPYTVRVRAMLSEGGWTDYSLPSESAFTLEKKAPPRPSPPKPSAILATSASFVMNSPASIFAVQGFKTQYRFIGKYEVDTVMSLHRESVPLGITGRPVTQLWVDGPTVEASTSSQYSGYVTTSTQRNGTNTAGSVNSAGKTSRSPLVVEITGLQPSTEYEIHIRSFNEVGISPYSTAVSFITSNDTSNLAGDGSNDVYTPKPPTLSPDEDQFIAIGTTSISLLVTPSLVNDNAGRLTTATPSQLRGTYSLQYRTDYQTEYRTSSDVVQFTAPRGSTFIQEIRTRTDSPSCTGFFWLRIDPFSVPGEAVSPWRFIITKPIRITATAEEVAAAIVATGKVQGGEPHLVVRRVANKSKGYTWTIEMLGRVGGDLGTPPKEGRGLVRIAVHRHTFVYENVTVTNNGTIVSTSTCFSPEPTQPILTRIVEKQVDTSSTEPAMFTIGGLVPLTNYYFRTKVTYEEGINGRNRVLGSSTSATIDSMTRYSDELFVTTKSDIPESESVNLIQERGLWNTSFHSVLPAPRGPSTLPNHLTQSTPPRYPSLTASGTGTTPARQADFHYPAGVGIGGLGYEAGGAGHCILLTYTPSKSRPWSLAYRYYFTGGEQTFTIPYPTPYTGVVTNVTMKCWGAGGGGGGEISKNMSAASSGGGAAFAQATIGVTPGDILTMIVGGPGQPPLGERGGAGGYIGGGDGGSSLDGVGAGGGGGASLVKINEDIVIVAAGGAGAGSLSDKVCCVDGAGGASSETSTEVSLEGRELRQIEDEDEDRAGPVRRRLQAVINDGSTASAFTAGAIVPAALRLDGVFPSIVGSGGGGATVSTGGISGISVNSDARPGNANVLDFSGVAVASQGPGVGQIAKSGDFLQGGNGAGGVIAGGGGGGGYFGTLL